MPHPNAHLKRCIGVDGDSEFASNSVVQVTYESFETFSNAAMNFLFLLNVSYMSQYKRKRQLCCSHGFSGFFGHFPVHQKREKYRLFPGKYSQYSNPKDNTPIERI